MDSNPKIIAKKSFCGRITVIEKAKCARFYCIRLMMFSFCGLISVLRVVLPSVQARRAEIMVDGLPRACRYGRDRLFSIFPGSLCWILISLHQNVGKVCILVPAKPHGPENSVAGDLVTSRSGSCNRNKLEKFENDGFPNIFELKGRAVGSERFKLILRRNMMPNDGVKSKIH